MTRTICRSAVSAIALALSAPAALADVSAAEVWQAWQDMAAEDDATLTADTRDETGSGLRLGGVTLTVETEEPATGDADGPVTSTLTATLDQMTLEDAGDGTVRVTQSDSMALTQSSDGPDETVEMAFTVTMAGLSTKVSGDPGALSYAYAGPEVVVALDRLTIDGTESDGRGTATLTGVSGTYELTGGGDAATMDSTSSAERLVLDLDFAIEEDDTEAEDSAAADGGAPARVAITADYADLTTTASGDRTTLAEMIDPAAIDDATRSVSGSYGHGGGGFTLDLTDTEGATLKADARSGGGSVDFAVDGPSTSWSGSTQDMAVDLSGSAIPVQSAGFSARQVGLGLTVPTAPAGTAPGAEGDTGAEDDTGTGTASGATQGDFAMRVALNGLEVSERLWSIVDPAGAVSRDPADLVLDLSGTGRFGRVPGALGAEAMADAMPGQLQSLDVNELRVSIAGAELTGEGGFTFDAGDLETFQGLAAPEGGIDLHLTGAEQLLDTLTTVGLVPEQQAMGARMMLSLFATETGDDTYDSRIEVGPGDRVSINGQQVR